MSKTLKEQLGNIFVNGRGEVCANLETTRSKAGAEVREKRKNVEQAKSQHEDAAKSRKKLQELRSREREMEQKIKLLRSEGLKKGPGSEQCALLFAEANEINDELRGVRKGIRKLNKRLHK